MKYVFGIGITVCIGFLSLSTVHAIDACGPGSGRDPYRLPEGCEGEGTFDAACETSRILNRGDEQTCCVAICENEADELTENPEEYKKLVSFFGSVLALESGNQVTFLINLAITSFLGVIGAYALIRGVYIGGVVRARTTNEEEIAKVNKELGVMIIAASIAFGFMIIIQLVASALGLGGLSDLVLVSEDGEDGTTVTIN